MQHDREEDAHPVVVVHHEDPRPLARLRLDCQRIHLLLLSVG
jgi:hypothetical protein